MNIPRDFYLVLCEFPTLRGKPWALVHDDLPDRDDAFVAMCEHYKDGSHGIPSLGNCRVLRAQDDVPPREVSDEFVEMWNNWQEEKAA